MTKIIIRAPPDIHKVILSIKKVQFWFPVLSLRYGNILENLLVDVCFSLNLNLDSNQFYLTFLILSANIN